MDRQLDSLEDAVRNMRRVVETPGPVHMQVLTGCSDEMRSLKGKLEKEILPLDEYERCKERDSHIECDLFDLRVAVSRLMEE